MREMENQLMKRLKMVKGSTEVTRRKESFKTEIINAEGGLPGEKSDEGTVSFRK